MRKGLEIDCNVMVELVTSYLDDALPPIERERFEDHLALCDGCDVYVEQMRAVIFATGRLGPEDVPQRTMDRLINAFRDWRSAAEH